VDEQKRDGIVSIVAAIAASALAGSKHAKPANAPALWPRVDELKETAKKLKIKHDKAAKRATLLAAIHAYWLALPAERKDALCSPAAAAHARQPQLAMRPAPAAVPAPANAPAAAVAAAVAAVLARNQAAAVAAGQQQAVRDAGEAGEGAAETVEAEAEVEVAAEAEAELAVAASLLDTLALVDEQTCAACTPVCGERFSHLTMTTTAKGYAKQWVCIDREACLARQMAGAGERRKVPRRC
jgi:hypothetical protein